MGDENTAPLRKRARWRPKRVRWNEYPVKRNQTLNDAMREACKFASKLDPDCVINIVTTELESVIVFYWD